MGDKSPKSKDREKNQKVAAKTQSNTAQAKKQAGYSNAAAAGKDAKKK